MTQHLNHCITYISEVTFNVSATEKQEGEEEEVKNDECDQSSESDDEGM